MHLPVHFAADLFFAVPVCNSVQVYSTAKTGRKNYNVEPPLPVIARLFADFEFATAELLTDYCPALNGLWRLY